MLPNGFVVVLDRALAELPRPRFAALLLGVVREDVWLVPLLGALPSPSRGHIYPRSRARCAGLVARALAEPDPLAADVTLGRALHVLIDMACPVHAQAVWHYLRDPFERYVDAHAGELATLPVPAVAPAPPEALVDSLAGAARAERTRRRRRDPPLGRPELAEQAARLIPLAAGHARALVANYQECRSTR